MKSVAKRNYSRTARAILAGVGSALHTGHDQNSRRKLHLARCEEGVSGVLDFLLHAKQLLASELSDLCSKCVAQLDSQRPEFLCGQWSAELEIQNSFAHI